MLVVDPLDDHCIPRKMTATVPRTSQRLGSGKKMITGWYRGAINTAPFEQRLAAEGIAECGVTSYCRLSPVDAARRFHSHGAISLARMRVRKVVGTFVLRVSRWPTARPLTTGSTESARSTRLDYPHQRLHEVVEKALAPILIVRLGHVLLGKKIVVGMILLPCLFLPFARHLSLFLSLCHRPLV